MESCAVSEGVTLAFAWLRTGGDRWEILLKEGVMKNLATLTVFASSLTSCGHVAEKESRLASECLGEGEIAPSTELRKWFDARSEALAPNSREALQRRAEDPNLLKKMRSPTPCTLHRRKSFYAIALILRSEGYRTQ